MFELVSCEFVGVVRLLNQLSEAVRQEPAAPWSVFARGLGEQGADGRTALAWRWALTGACASPVTLTPAAGLRPPAGSTNRAGPLARRAPRTRHTAHNGQPVPDRRPRVVPEQGPEPQLRDDAGAHRPPGRPATVPAPGLPPPETRHGHHRHSQTNAPTAHRRGKLSRKARLAGTAGQHTATAAPHVPGHVLARAKNSTGADSPSPRAITPTPSCTRSR